MLKYYFDDFLKDIKEEDQEKDVYLQVVEMTGIISRGRERIEACNENINKLTNNLGLVTNSL